jgi:hypothetical protein
MTYPDPKLVRDHRFSINFNTYERNLIIAVSQYLGAEPAAVIRELALMSADSFFGLQPTEASSQSQGANKVL